MFLILIMALIVVAALFICAVYHHIMLHLEKNKMTHIGTLVKVDGYMMNVYIEGEKKDDNAPTIVLLSGSGVPSPVYDYKILYSKLSDTYRIAVVEKFGYGYSDISGLPRDVAGMVEQNRKALQAAGVYPPYSLMPHSMSALEAIYWTNHYPDEIVNIIGLDMAVPSSYQKSNLPRITFMKAMTFFGVHRVPAIYYVNKTGLSNPEYEQNKMLAYKNSLNRDVYEECKVVLDNAKIVGGMTIPDVPILMFTTNLGQSPGHEEWKSAQLDFASKAKDCIQIELDCGHELHYYLSDEISNRIKEFL
jgi:pimeloyl-ACP methyl ester carboxylesterase